MNENSFNSLDDSLLLEKEDDKLYITEEICDHWRETSKWTYGIAFAGFLVVGMFALALIFLMASSIEIHLGAIFIFGGLILLVYFLSRNLYRSSWRIKSAADYSIWEDMELGFANLNTAYVIYGVTLLVGLLVIVALLIFVLFLDPSTIIIHNN